MSNVRHQKAVVHHPPLVATMKIFALALLVLLIEGCAIHQAPYIAYNERAIPLKNTAVLVAHVYNSGNDLRPAGVDQADGVSLNCFNACPVWVRVLPGTHTFKIKYMDSFQMSGGAISFQVAFIPVTIEEMRAGHTYKLSYTRSGKMVIARVEDLGAERGLGYENLRHVR